MCTPARLRSSEFSSVYNQPTVVHDDAAGTFDAVTTGLNPVYANDDVQARNSLYLATLRFRVVGGAGTTAARVLRARSLNLLGGAGAMNKNIDGVAGVKIDQATGFPMDSDGVVDLSVFEF